MSLTAFVSLKAYGDLVIQLSVLGRIAAPHRDRFVSAVGTHLLKLRDALGSSVPFVEVRHAESSVPAIFDLKKSGRVQAVKSLLTMRRALAALPLQVEATLVFDRVGWRESLLAGQRRAVSLASTQADNIYAAYECLLAASGATLTSSTLKPREPQRDGTVGIFPGSRIHSKTLSANTVAALSRRCGSLGLKTRIFLLRGEALDAPISGFETILPRFSNMVEAVTACDYVISADSMPAHMAEFYSIPVFVLSRRPNVYWLPLSAFQQRRWALIDEVEASPHLNRFLSSQ